MNNLIANYKKGIKWSDLRPGGTVYAYIIRNGEEKHYFGMIDTIRADKVSLIRVYDITNSTHLFSNDLTAKKEFCYLIDEKGTKHWFN